GARLLGALLLLGPGSAGEHVVVRPGGLRFGLRRRAGRLRLGGRFGFPTRGVGGLDRFGLDGRREAARARLRQRLALRLLLVGGGGLLRGGAFESGGLRRSIRGGRGGFVEREVGLLRRGRLVRAGERRGGRAGGRSRQGALFAGRPEERRGVVALEVGEHLDLGEEEGAETRGDLGLAAAQLDDVLPDVVPLLLGVLEHPLGAEFGLLDDQPGALPGGVLRPARRLARGVEGFLKRELDLLVVLQLGLQLAHALLGLPLVFEHLLPVGCQLLDEAAHLVGIVAAAELLLELLLAEVEGRELHGEANSESGGDAAARRRIGGRSAGMGGGPSWAPASRPGSGRSNRRSRWARASARRCNRPSCSVACVARARSRRRTRAASTSADARSTRSRGTSQSMPQAKEIPTRVQPRSPNSAEPTRTCVAPSSMATSKSPLMPIERCARRTFGGPPR